MRVFCEFILCRQGRAHFLKMALSPFSLFPPQWVVSLWAPWAHTPGRPIKDSYNLDLPWAHLTAPLEGPSSSSSTCFLPLRSAFLSQQEADLRCPTPTHLSPPPAPPTTTPADDLLEAPAPLTSGHSGSAEWLSLCLHCMMAGSVMGAKDHHVHWMRLWGWRDPSTCSHKGPLINHLPLLLPQAAPHPAPQTTTTFSIMAFLSLQSFSLVTHWQGSKPGPLASDTLHFLMKLTAQEKPLLFFWLCWVFSTWAFTSYRA